MDMLFQFVAIAFAIGPNHSADVTVIDRRLPSYECTARAERASIYPTDIIWSDHRDTYINIGDAVPACIPDNIDF